jgi:hypothetical protein
VEKKRKGGQEHKQRRIAQAAQWAAAAKNLEFIRTDPF